MQKRPILRRILYRVIEGFLITIVGFTFFDLLWYGYDTVKALLDGGDLSTIKFKLTLNLTRLFALAILYSFVMIILDSLDINTKGPLLGWIEDRYSGKPKRTVN